jgi:beta-galactosidase
MKRVHSIVFTVLLASSLLLMGTLSAESVPAPAPAVHQLHVRGDHFEMDGKPFQIISGAIHSARVPRAYWRDRLQKAKAMGLNTVETYVFWDLHEPEPGHFDFSGQNDIAEFVREAQQEGLYVILRPGPYVCAEWDLGGLPSWLLKEPKMAVRSSNPAFMAAASRWLHRLGEELAPLQSTNGGPIIAVQVENEYGGYGSDHGYMEKIHHLLLDAGFDRAMMFTADGVADVERGSLPELPAAINFGTGEARLDFAALANVRPKGPRMCAEYWDGWFDHWGEKHHRGDPTTEADELKWMLQQGYSVNLYMFHGGTSFGWMSGANISLKRYQPDVTSYDYDVPVSESGALGPKFFLFRDVIRQVTGKTPPAPPKPLVSRALDPVTLKVSASIWENLPQPIASERVLSMEDVGQSYGYILYRTTIADGQSGKLRLEELHSYAQVYLDGVLAGRLDRRSRRPSLTIHPAHANTRLDILVENTGRVNFGHRINGERAGITRRVTLGGKQLSGWQIYPLAMEQVSSLPFAPATCTGACFYRGVFTVQKPADTFVDTRQFGKGQVWINGRPLGRFWKIGPQRTLYLPAPWLKEGENEIVVFDLNGAAEKTVSFVAKPLLGGSGR